MKRWVSDLPVPPVGKWRSRSEIIREHGDRQELTRLLDMKSILEALKREYYARKYDPNQPRVPAGNPDGGQWTNGSGSAASGRSNRIATRRTRGLEAECDAQYRRDTVICNLVRTPLCWANAMQRYAACLAGRPIPELRF
jgi:hypothetical protein